MTNYIYALVDPFTDEIRYIGKTIRPKERLANECNEKTCTHRCHWIQGLLAKGKRPNQIILETVNGDNWQERERYWISEAKRLDWPLVNGTSGGDGVKDLTPESKARMLATWIGRKHKPESLLKIGAASKGRVHDDKYKKFMHDKMTGRYFSLETRNRLSQSIRKLTDDQVREIRRLIAKGGLSQREISDRYKVDKGTISNIKRNLFYKDVL